MFDTFLGFGDQVLSGIMLIVCAGISSHIMFGYGTRRGKETFIGLVLVLAVGIQTTKFHMYNQDYRRSDCTKSGKGGKRPSDSKNHYDINPCFCHINATCVDATTNIAINTTLTPVCPTDGSAKCLSVDGKEVQLFITDKRNCNGGSGPECTYKDPCFPCELDTIFGFQGGRCQQCTTDNVGDCHFVPGVGPYCYETPGSRKVVPCKRCCTPSTPIMVDGQCF